MKKQYINDFSPGDFIDDFFVLSEKAVAQKKDGDNYLTITLSDKTGSIKGVVWDNVDRIADGPSSGDVGSNSNSHSMAGCPIGAPGGGETAPGWENAAAGRSRPQNQDIGFQPFFLSFDLQKHCHPPSLF